MSLDEDLKKEIEEASTENLEKVDDEEKEALAEEKRKRLAEIEALKEAAKAAGQWEDEEPPADE
ncbi:MAG TPA: hypothetical protein VKK79_02065 [Candidatus Lokiarchaeia archaeon]|nr:hypothetical protein [Candidatus Lokiarchaeia archaeon]